MFQIYLSEGGHWLFVFGVSDRQKRMVIVSDVEEFWFPSRRHHPDLQSGKSAVRAMRPEGKAGTEPPAGHRPLQVADTTNTATPLVPIKVLETPFQCFRLQVSVVPRKPTLVQNVDNEPTSKIGRHETNNLSNSIGWLTRALSSQI